MAQKPTYKQLELKIKAYEKQIENAKDTDQSTREARRDYKRFLQFLPYPVLVRDANELITYLNPAFTKTFGWASKDLKGNNENLCIPDNLKNEINDKVKKLASHENILQLNTQRLTKDGKILDVVIRIGVDKDKDNNPGEMIIVLKDTTMELRNKRNRHTIIRISQALPQYPDLKKLLFYVNTEIKELLGTQGANVILLDKTQKKFYLVSAAHDDPDTRERIEKIKFSINELLAGQVVKTGKPMIVNNFSDGPHKYSSRDQKIGYKIENVILVPLRNKDNIIGILAADNKKTGGFDNTDLESLNTIATTVALSIENARVSRRLRKAYEELKSLNIAKDKMISHLSHELKTPVAILLSSFKILSKRLTHIDETTWLPTMERIERNLKRIIGIEDEVYDIVENKEVLHNKIFSLILEQCQDEFEALIAQEIGEKGVIAKVRQRIEDIFTTKNPIIQDILLSKFVAKRIESLKTDMLHRNINLIAHIKPTPSIKIPAEPLRKTIDGLIRNAVENTPDGGVIEIFVNQNGKKVQFIVKDHGIGLTKETQKRIFEGFFSTQKTMDYSSKRPFDFNAGGKGADLLRMKIFSEKYNFKISMASKRCRHIPDDMDICPGVVGECNKNTKPACGGETIVTCLFPLHKD
ncbi:MAG: GAF domain-containing protein [Desulfobacula sp.]|nr:GAF domain-containing protein [Desulfobacula sp.]